MAIQAVRGAIQVAQDDPAEIRDATRELISQVLAENDLHADALISISFTMTPDLVSEFPALAAHEAGLVDVPMMCAVEINVPGAMPRVIRMMALVYTDLPRTALKHSYLRGAAGTRPDVVVSARRSPST
ncbi:chorismate mutase [Streptomyces parvus]|uniref:chorismate mutase n=1 Tax=Streptomyces parvus TaxID=66428 RepID=UPI003690E067